ncbi:MAG TPA: hypothetical protein H9805_14830 [Candidatus Janibacter merdipullorum]|nr:hypothetical protein [Candidatus Janibacter merdipullorum]
MGFAEYRVVRDGRTIRRLVFEEELTVEEGEPVIDESEFLFDDVDVLTLAGDAYGAPGGEGGRA